MKAKNTRIYILAVTLFLFVILTILVLNGILSKVENSIYTILSYKINPKTTKIMILISDLGSAISVIIIMMFSLLLPKTRKKLGIPLSITIAISTGLNLLLKNIFRRNRPEILQLVWESSFSFPSAHAMINMSLYAIIAFSAYKHIKSKKTLAIIMIICFIMPIFIGISRVYLGVHYSGDVVCGWLLGFAITLAVDTILSSRFNLDQDLFLKH